MLDKLTKIRKSKTRSISAENPTGAPGMGGRATLEEGIAANAARDLGTGWKVNPYIRIPAKETWTLGATPVTYPYRNECCGAYVALDDKAPAEKQVDRALNSAIAAGCEELITACPLCMYNLVENATAHKLPVKYFTELLAEALGVKEG